MVIKDFRLFDPERYASLEADMWVAYYNHQFLRLFVLLFKLNHLQFQPSYLLTLRGAYHAARAAVVFRLTKGHENNRLVLMHLTQFFRLVSDHGVRQFDYKKAAQLELDWWMVDRYPERFKVTRATAIAASMAVMCNVDPARLRVYGQKRAAAMELLGNYHHDVTTEVDWPLLRKLLRESFHALHDAVQT